MNFIPNTQAHYQDTMDGLGHFEWLGKESIGPAGGVACKHSYVRRRFKNILADAFALWVRGE